MTMTALEKAAHGIGLPAVVDVETFKRHVRDFSMDLGKKDDTQAELEMKGLAALYLRTPTDPLSQMFTVPLLEWSSKQYGLKLLGLLPV